MRLDIRMPIGSMFLLLGALLVAYGALGDPAVYRRSLGINVNLWWGSVLVVVGGLMLALARRARR